MLRAGLSVGVDYQSGKRVAGQARIRRVAEGWRNGQDCGRSESRECIAAVVRERQGTPHRNTSDYQDGGQVRKGNARDLY